MKSKEVAVLEKEIAPLVREEVIIATPDDMRVATEELSQLIRYADRVKKAKEAITKPLNAALKATRDQYRPLEERTDAQIQMRRDAMGTYQLEAERAAQKEEQRIADRVGEGKGHLKPETAVRQMEQIEKPDAHIATDSGSVKFRTDYKLEITDLDKTLASVFTLKLYDLVDLREGDLLKYLKAGNAVEGATTREVRTPINSR